MSRNIMSVLMYHRHKLLDLINYKSACCFVWVGNSVTSTKDQNIGWVSFCEGFSRLCRKCKQGFRVVSWSCSSVSAYIAVTTFSVISLWVHQLRMWKLLKCFDVHSSCHLQNKFFSKFSGVYVEVVITRRRVSQFPSSGWSDDGEAKYQNSNWECLRKMFGPKWRGGIKFQ
jgi:hypothetical protein